MVKANSNKYMGSFGAIKNKEDNFYSYQLGWNRGKIITFVPSLILG